MQLCTLDELQSPIGQAALAEAATLATDESAYLSAHKRLSKRYPDELARAALDTVILRRRALHKFPQAQQLFFTREALEQSTSEPVAEYRASRFAGLSVVADLCCGIGGDAMSLARRGTVIAVDCDPLHLKMCALNLAACGVGDRATLVEADALTVVLPPHDGVFIDPDRRPKGGKQVGRRVLSVDRYQPPLPEMLSRMAADTPLGVKLAPGLDRRELEPYSGEIEFISYEGELREAVLWRGPIAGPRHRATLLPSRATLSAEAPELPPGADEPGEILYEPDAAVIRADLVGLLADQLGAWAVEDGFALLSGDDLCETPLAKAHRIEATLPAKPKMVREYLREHGIGRIQVRRHGVDVDAASFARQIRVEGDHFRTVMLTRASGRMVALVLNATMSE